MEPMCDGERAGQERKHTVQGALQHSEAFLCQIYAYMLRDKAGKTLSGYMCPARNTEPVTGDDVNTG